MPGDDTPDPSIDFPQPARFRRPSPRLTPNRVRIERALFTQDRAAGRQPEYSTDPQAAFCSITPTSAEDRPEHTREQGVTYYTGKFYDDPRLAIRDKITWQGLKLIVAGVRPSSAGLNRSYVVDFEYRPSNRDG